MSRTYTLYSPAEMETINAWAARKGSLSQLYELFPYRTPEAIRHKVAKLGFVHFKKNNSLSKAEEKQIKQMAAAGATWSDIFASMPQHSHAIIRNFGYRNKLQIKKSGKNIFAKREEIERLILQGGYSTSEIAAFYGISRKYAAQIRSQIGLSRADVKALEAERMDNVANVKKKDIVAELQARESELEAMLPASVANGTTAEILSKLNAVRLKIHNLQKNSDYIINTI